MRGVTELCRPAHLICEFLLTRLMRGVTYCQMVGRGTRLFLLTRLMRGVTQSFRNMHI